jgi:hypothetical protein
MTWKDIIGYEGLYQISEYGDVKSLYYNISHIKEDSKLNPKILEPTNLSKNRRYKSIKLSKKTEYKKEITVHTIHHLVYDVFIGERDTNMIIDHKDEDRNNNHYSNLEQITQKENIERYYTNKSNKRIIEDSKLCMKCNKDKSTSDFYLKAKKDIRDWNPDKWRTYCKECSKKNRKKK